MLHIQDRDQDSDSDDEESKTRRGEVEESRVILLLDLDCFEVQVLEKTENDNSYNPHNPAIVVNHDEVILSVNYAAKRLGVKRSDKLSWAYAKCGRDLQVLKTGTRYGKSDSFTPYEESDKILQSILDYKTNYPTIILNRASKDEFFLDVSEEVTNRLNSRQKFQCLPPKKIVSSLTQERKGRLDSYYKDQPMTVMEGREGKICDSTLNYRILQVYKNPETKRPYHRDEIRPVFGAIIAHEIIEEIYENTGGYVASVGVAHNKLRAKVASDLNKPEGICILTDMGFQRLARTRFTICHLPGFGGTEGSRFEQALKHYFTSENPKLTQVLSLSLDQLVAIYQSAGIKLGDSETAMLSLLEKCQGTDNSSVPYKLHNDSLTTSTAFKYCSKLKQFENMVHLLCCDMRDRLKYNQQQFNREASSVSVKIRQNHNGNDMDSGNREQTELTIGANGLPEVNQMENLIFDNMQELDASFRDIFKISLTANRMKLI